MTNRIIEAIDVDGTVYEIPEAWIAGFCKIHGPSTINAVQHWITQAKLEKSQQPVYIYWPPELG